jgi:hypothetical protein
MRIEEQKRYMIEDKIRAVVKYEVATGVPLVQ